MSEFFKSKRNSILAVGAFFLAVTVLAGSLAYFLEEVTGIVGLASFGSESGLRGEVEDEPPGNADYGFDEEDEPFIPEPEPVPVSFSRPSEMRGVFFAPGIDFITTPDTSTETIKSEIDKAIAAAKGLTMNTVIIETSYEDKVIYSTRNSPELSRDFDIMDYIVNRCREEGLYTYAIFDASLYSGTTGSKLLSIGGAGADTLAYNLREFAERYPVDAILLDGYLNAQNPASYSIYSFMGAAIGFDNFMRQTPEAVMRTFSRTLRKYAAGVQVGLLADAVWQNDTEHENGSATKAAFTAFGSGFADTKSFLMDGLVDFVAVKAYSATTDTAAPFGEVVRWWADVSREAGVPMYAVHASSKLATQETGWTSQDQLIRQVIEAEEIPGFGGSIFNSLKRLSDNPQSATTALLKYFSEEVETTHILTELEITKPEQASFKTTEPVQEFRGASDPNFPVTINGTEIPTDANGYITVTLDLKGGENTFTVKHKDKTLTYTINREIEILREVAPQGDITAEGGMSIPITAYAYAEASVHAVINGETVQMQVDEDGPEDEAARDSSYKRFTGHYRAPAATSSEQNLGGITVYATWQGQEKSIRGGNIKVNKKVQIEDGVPVVVIADQAMTYPPNTLDNIPNANYYPLPQGAMDYAIGEEIVYTKNGQTYKYHVLASKLRVESSDIAVSKDFVSGNAISGMSVRSEGGYTYLTIKTAQQVSYSFAYTNDGVRITFNNTTSTPNDARLGSNAIFKNASWSDNGVLSLSFVKAGGFMGYKAYYESGDLVFRFNNPPNSISGARIAIDPGHGGGDIGAKGFLTEFHEARINRDIAALLAKELQSRGAAVLLLDTSGGMEMKERVRQAESFRADMFISIHNNTAPNANATGTEVYYFYPFSRTLAAASSANVSSRLSTNNRGARQSYYHITLSSQMASVLVEGGFMSNKGEYEKLINPKGQAQIAAGIADAVASSIKAAATGFVDDAPTQTAPPVEEAPGNEGPPSEETPGSEGPPTEESSGGEGPPTEENGGNAGGSQPNNNTDNDNEPGKGKVEAIFLSYEDLEMEVGQSIILSADIEPASERGRTVTWSSRNTAVATVNSNGRVTAISEGTVRITATVDGKTATCTVKVVTAEDEKAVTGTNVSGGTSGGSKSTAVSLKDIEYIDFVESAVTMYIRTTQALELISDKDKAVDNSLLKWETSDRSIARVDDNGVVTAQNKTGTTSITAYTDDDSLYAVCVITVTNQKVAVTGMTLSHSSLTLARDDVFKDLKANINPTNATNKGIRWSSSNTRVATVDQNGVITARARGQATIVAVSDDGKFRATCSVEVVNSIEIEELILEHGSFEMRVGEEFDIFFDTWPEVAAKVEVVWSSSDSSVVSVDQEGWVKALKKGTATIRIQLKSDSTLFDTCKITVY